MWFFMDRVAFSKIWEFLRFGLPASTMLVIELWGYDLICIYSGWLGIKQLTACLLMFQIFMIFMINSFAVAFTSIGFIGNSLGENHPKKAQKYAYATMVFGCF